MRSHNIYMKALRERLSRFKRDQNSEFSRRLVRVTKNYLFTQTILDKIYETMSRNQAKLGRTRKL